MALAALLVSVFALVAASASAYYARSQAKETQRLAAIEADRHHAERMPQLKASIEPEGGDWYRLQLILTSGSPLDIVGLEILNKYGAVFPGEGPISAVSGQPTWPSLKPGDQASWEIDFDQEVRVVHLRVTCRSGKEMWNVLAEADTPYDVLDSIH